MEEYKIKLFLCLGWIGSELAKCCDKKHARHAALFKQLLKQNLSLTEVAVVKQEKESHPSGSSCIDDNMCELCKLEQVESPCIP